MKLNNQRHRTAAKLLFLFASGALLTFAFAPCNCFFLAYLCPLLLLYYWNKASAKQAFWQGWTFGIGFFSTGISWVFISIYRYGGQPASISVAITGLFIGILGLCFALQGYLYRKFSTEKTSKLEQLLLFPSLWVLFELLRAHVLTGFPWLFLGYSQLATPLKAIAPLAGIYGVSYVTLVLVVFLNFLLTCTQLRHRLVSALIIIMLITTCWYLENFAWTTVKKTPITIHSIQGNIAQSLKWSPEMLSASLQQYHTLSAPILNKTHQILLWPENAIPAFPQDITDELMSLDTHLKAKHNTLITGLPLYLSHQYYNGALVLGDGHGLYLKQHLVPFGEYIPFSELLGKFFDWLAIPMSNFSSGPDNQKLLTIAHWQVAVLICYEIAYPNLVRRMSSAAQFLATLSDDGWFGRSLGPWQQAQMAQMRALETGRYVVNSTNNGITTVDDPQGREIASLPQDQAKVLTTTIYPAYGQTPWQILGNWPLMGILFLSLLAILSRKLVKF